MSHSQSAKKRPHLDVMLRCSVMVLTIGLLTPRPLCGFQQDHVLKPRPAKKRLGELSLRHFGAIRSLNFTDKNETLASVGMDHQARIWDLRSKREVVRLKAFAAVFPSGGRHALVIPPEPNAPVSKYPIPGKALAPVSQGPTQGIRPKHSGTGRQQRDSTR
jgi:hypothetical protein